MTGTLHQRFTGKERDSETSNDFFGARYFSGAQGRFTSPDPKQITTMQVLDQQQWNMYSYVRNSPLIATDPDGREMKIILLNSAGYTQNTMDRVATATKAKFTQAGVLNVSTQVINNPSTWQAIKADLQSALDKHTSTVEISGGKGKEKGLVSLDPKDSRELGQQNSRGAIGNYGAVVDGPAITSVAENGNENATALTNVTTHELGHEGGLGDDGTSPIMNGVDDKKGLNDPNKQFTPEQTEKLRQTFNRPNEKLQ